MPTIMPRTEHHYHIKKFNQLEIFRSAHMGLDHTQEKN